MKLKIKLSIMVIAILVAVVAGISVLLLSRASNNSIDLNKKIIKSISGKEANYWEGRLGGHIRMLSTLADVMADYEDIDPEDRRNTYDIMLRGTLTSQPGIQNIYTVWRPNAVDGMDAKMIGRPGSTETGQYAVAFTRENGPIEVRPTTDVNAAMAYINGPNATKARVEDPIARTVQGKNIHLLRAMAPIINPHTKQVVGGVGMLLSIETVQPSVQATITANKEIAVMGIFTNKGFIVGHGFADRIGKNFMETETVLGDNIQAAFRALGDGKEFTASAYSTAMGTDLEFFFAPFTIGDSDVTWTVMIATREDYILSEVNDMRNSTIIVALIVAAAVAVAVYLVLHFTIKPVVNVAATLKDIAQGEGDLTVTIPIKGNDEISDLSLYFNQTLGKIKDLIKIIKTEAGKLSNIGQDLASNMNETAAAVNEITANIQSIKGRVINQSASVSETHATMEQLTANINRLDGHVENQISHMSNSTAAIEEMVANTRSVTDTLIKNTANVKSLRDSSETGRSGLQEVSADIQEISRESEGLMEINSVMENIASQTNLLSMNAAIEAAHAGEAGKGFAVVADEIRKLAESSSEQSKTIGSVLKKIKESIDKISRSTSNVLSGFEAIDSNVKIVAQQEDVIRNSMEEQGQGSKQVLEGVGKMNEISQEVRKGTQEMLEGANEVQRESLNLEKMTQEITSGMNEMATGADQINTAVNQVNEISIKNREGISSLIKEVSRFKVD